MRKIFPLLLLLLISSLRAQQPATTNAAEIYKKIQQLNFLGSVLYIAAHPDDENTRLISYLSNGLHARTGYLSITRGDGGQNLIGPELGSLLGVIRTQELLAARRIDGGHQYFTRANDFGYSKHPKETLEFWEKEEVLKDVVARIREFRPDVIINRFDHTTPGTTHGHHTTSAILSVEAFDLAADPSAFPEQLNRLKPWQPKKLFHNTSPWFFDDKEAFEVLKADYLELETGVYYPLLGMSNTEIAALSRSEHSSQGFGSSGTRGEAKDYLDLIKGSHPAGEKELFSGINTQWSRIPGGTEIGKILEEVEDNFNFKDPAASIPGLVSAYHKITKLKDDHWRILKTEEIKEIIAACAGLYLEAVAGKQTATKGERIHLRLEAINRSPQNMTLNSLRILPNGREFSPEIPLTENQSWTTETSIDISSAATYTTPYWLEEKGSTGMYKVNKPELIGIPETPEQFKVVFSVDIGGISIPFTRPIVHKTTDPAKGEIYRPFDILPKVSVKVIDPVNIFPDPTARTVQVALMGQKDSLQGVLKLEVPEGWEVSPASKKFHLKHQDEVKIFSFSVTPPLGSGEGLLIPKAEIKGEYFTEEIVSIDYDHIPSQKVLLPAAAKLVKLDIKKRGKLIGYIQGAGDAVPESLEQIGYKVVLLDPETLSAKALDPFDAVVVGIRAYNTVEVLPSKQQELLEYVKNGGNLITQYNTSQRLNFNALAPYPLQLSRNRVTDEKSPVYFLAPDHPVLNGPNKITIEDFQGWVQERGLYFPDAWGPEYTSILAMNDPGEKPLTGSVLIAPYGKGNFVYTGLSFFRELPAGVPGAFRLFANLISLEAPNPEPPKELPSK